jgi:glycosyltransferase 2 family protein
MSKRMHGWWRYGIAIVAAGFLVWYVSPSALAATLRHTHPLWLTLYLGAFLLVPVLYGVQLLGALRLAGHRIPAAPVIAAATQAWGIGTLTPARAGDLSLAYFLGGRIPESDAIAAVSIDKLVSLMTLALLALVSAAGIALPYGDVLLFGAAIAIGGTVVMLAIVCVRGADSPVRALARRWLGANAEAAWERVRALAGSPRVLAWCLAMTTVRWLYICGSNLLVFRAVAEHPDFRHVVAATAVGRIISIVPISIGGVGIKEPAQIVIYRANDVPAEAVLAVSALGFACGLVIAAIAPLLAGAVMRAEPEVR